MPGFGPAAEVLLFRQKDPKQFPPGRGPVGGTFVPGQIMVANNSLRSNRFARESYLARDSAAPKAGILSSDVIPDIINRESIFPLTYFSVY